MLCLGLPKPLQAMRSGEPTAARSLRSCGFRVSSCWFRQQILVAPRLLRAVHRELVAISTKNSKRFGTTRTRTRTTWPKLLPSSSSPPGRFQGMPGFRASRPIRRCIASRGADFVLRHVVRPAICRCCTLVGFSWQAFGAFHAASLRLFGMPLHAEAVFPVMEATFVCCMSGAPAKVSEAYSVLCHGQSMYERARGHAGLRHDSLDVY